MGNVGEIIIIDNNKQEFIDALKNIKDGFSILYSNCKIELGVGEYIVNSMFKTILYNENSNKVIMLTLDSKFCKEDIIFYLDNNNLDYSEITFQNNKEESNDLVNFSFVNDRKSLEKVLVDSLSEGSMNALYYPFLLGNLSFGYTSNAEKFYSIFNDKYKGLINIDNRIILLRDYINNPIIIRSVLNILSNLNIKTKLMTDRGNKENVKRLLKIK